MACTYSQNFNDFDNGTIDLQDGTIITGQAAQVIDGRLQLTRDGEGLGFRVFHFQWRILERIYSDFDYELNDDQGVTIPLMVFHSITVTLNWVKEDRQKRHG